MYFKNFPKMLYSLDGSATNFVMTDLFRRVISSDNNTIGTLSYDEYDVLDGETPEIVAAKIYDNAELHWVILLVNNIIDPRYDWPLPVDTLNTLITNKYGAGNEYAVHHYIDENNDIVHSSFAGTKYPVSNYTYEEELNETRRRIKILKPNYVSQYIQNFEQAIGR